MYRWGLLLCAKCRRGGQKRIQRKRVCATNKMKHVYFLLILCVSFFVKTNAQNLVPNYSFETYTSCPTGSSQIYLAVPWKGVTTNSSDYFNVCGTGGATVPICCVG